MQIIESPFPYSHVENPMIIKFSKDTPDKVVFSIVIQGKTRYFTAYPKYDEQNEYFVVEFDLAKFLSPYFDDKSLMFIGYDFTLNGENNVVGYAVRGGISKRHFMQLKSMETSVFEYRFLNIEKQSFLTTRSQSNPLYIKRSELRYLYFFSNPNYSVTFSAIGLSPVTYPKGNFDLVCFDAASWMGTTLLSQIFVTKDEGAPAVPIGSQVYIVDSVAENPTLLMFRNSLGVFEHIQLTGKGFIDSKFENESLSTLDTDYGDFKKGNTRAVKNQVIDLEAGYKSYDDLMFIQDLLHSDEVYLITGTEEIPCRVTTKNFRVPTVINTPQSIQLTVELTDEERNYTDLTPVVPGPVPPIFTDNMLLTPSGSAIFAYITV